MQTPTVQPIGSLPTAHAASPAAIGGDPIAHKLQAASTRGAQQAATIARKLQAARTNLPAMRARAMAAPLPALRRQA